MKPKTAASRKHLVKHRVDVDDTSTWTKFRKGLCTDCHAGCCTMPVEVKLADLVRMEVLIPFELKEPIRKIARRLMKKGLVEHFHFKSETFTLVRYANRDCLYLDPSTRRCTIYERRPDTCRNHPRIGPRSGYCPYRNRSDNGHP